MSFRNLPHATQLYIILLVIAGLASAILSFSYPLTRLPDISLGIYFLLVIITARMTVKIPYSDVHFSVDTPFIFVILVLYGLFPALMADAIAKFILTTPNVTKKTLFKIPFNMASGVLSIFGAGLAFQTLFFKNAATSSVYILPIIGMTFGYYLINTLSVALAISITEKRNLFIFWIKNFLPTGIGFIASGSIATLLFILDSIGSYLGFVVIIPLVGLIYYSQRLYLLKETEAINHIADLESFHISTIQSLSLALDAKDDYTHGHGHRVSCFAVGLAKLLGISDEPVLRGIAFAGLVHDIGKIAIPDVILNKPGKYTETEMNRMKIHPIISAEILKSIPLPFPVAKIVRHHHEKWNGRGYPDGLPGQSIPFESRILAVADVYDSIRSDRPYRPKMEKDRAIRILEGEKGHTLDPNMAELFLQNIDALEKSADVEFVQIVGNNIQDIVKASYLSYVGDEVIPTPDPTVEESRQAQLELQILNDLFALFSKGETLQEKLKEFAGTITKIVPYTAMVVYLPESNKLQRLRPAIVYGNDTELLPYNVIDVGSGVSGWVFENRTQMISAIPKSEFPSFGTASIPYKSVLSVPLVSVDQSVGVVSLYSENREIFSAKEQDMLVRICLIVGPLIKNLIEGKKGRKTPSSSTDSSEIIKGKNVVPIQKVIGEKN